MKTVAVRDGQILLGQLLKLAGIAETGGEARTILARGDVSVNGSVEQRRGRKLVEGDVVDVGGADYVVSRR